MSWKTSKDTVEVKNPYFGEDSFVYNFHPNEDHPPQHDEKWDTFSLEDYQKYTKKMVDLLKYFIFVLDVVPGEHRNDRVLWDEIVHNLSVTLRPQHVTELFAQIIENGRYEHIRCFTSRGWNPFIKPLGCKEPAIFALSKLHEGHNFVPHRVFCAIFDGMEDYYVRQLTTSRVSNPQLFKEKNEKWTENSLLQKELEQNKSHSKLLNYLLERGKNSHMISYKNWPILNEMVLRGNLEGVRILIEKGANPYFKGTRDMTEMNEEIMIKFDDMFRTSGNNWWERINAMQLAEMMEDSSVEDCIKQVFQHFCASHGILEDTLKEHQRNLCECRLCDFHPDYPKPSIIHMGEYARTFGQEKESGEEEDEGNQVDYTLKISNSNAELTELTKFVTEKPKKKEEIKVEVHSNLLSDCECKPVILHTPDTCNRFQSVTDDETSSVDSSASLETWLSHMRVSKRRRLDKREHMSSTESIIDSNDCVIYDEGYDGNSNNGELK